MLGYRTPSSGSHTGRNVHRSQWFAYILFYIISKSPPKRFKQYTLFPNFLIYITSIIDQIMKFLSKTSPKVLIRTKFSILHEFRTRSHHQKNCVLSIASHLVVSLDYSCKVNERAEFLQVTSAFLLGSTHAPTHTSRSAPRMHDKKYRET